MPIFGVSNMALIALLGYAGLVRWYNAQIMDIRVRVSLFLQEHATSEGAGSGLDVLLNNLATLPAPTSFGWLLIGIASLILASTWFRLRCPDEVQSFNLAQWIDGPNRDELQWYSADYSRRVERWACFVAYVSGGIITGTYLLIRLAEAISLYILK